MIRYPTNKGNQYYTVKPGDTLKSVGQQMGIPWQHVMNANSHMFGASLALNPGERLIMPRI